MSYSVLRDIEACPLRWSLRRADYPAIWDRPGYPAAPPLATIEGQIVHASLERIVLAASEDCGVSNALDVAHSDSQTQVQPAPMSDVVATLRRLGGITAVLEAALRNITAAWRQSPRLAPRGREWEFDLQRRLPALRQRVQSMLAHAGVARAATVRATPARSQTLRGQPDSRERAKEGLGRGVYPEVPLNNAVLAWYGKADLLTIDVRDDSNGVGEGDSECEITDFKTGSPKADHALQVRIYALLWASDKKLNPTGRRARNLKIVYSNRTVDVAPPSNEKELKELAAELAARTRAARTDISARPPIARPSAETCEWCDVKHMCATYWSTGTPAKDRQRPASATDIEVLILGKRSPTSWSARVTGVPVVGSELVPGANVLIRARAHDAHFSTILLAGRRVRLLAIQIMLPADESTPVPLLVLTRSSEAFLVESADAETDHAFS